MKTDNKGMNIYVQPDCKVYQVHHQQMIATSAGSASSSANEEYETGDTSTWF